MLLVLQILQFSLRIDGYINWDWNLVFWIFWMVTIMSVFYVMGLTILLILTLYYKYFGQAENFQSKYINKKDVFYFLIFLLVIGLFWCFSNICNFVVGLCLLLKGSINVLNKKEDGKIFEY